MTSTFVALATIKIDSSFNGHPEWQWLAEREKIEMIKQLIKHKVPGAELVTGGRLIRRSKEYTEFDLGLEIVC